MHYIVHAAQDDLPSIGNLQVNVTSITNAFPISGATIKLSYTGQPSSVIEELTTNSSGQTESVELPAPPLEYSLNPSSSQPYSEYNIQISAPGYESVEISGAEILPGEKAIQNIALLPQNEPATPEGITESTPLANTSELFVIPPHTLYYEYPPKIPEAEIKTTNETGEIVLSRVVIPEYVVVHDGPPSDASAKNYYVRYRDYIKNVASSEIYATWPESTIMANVLAIMSITLNRVYTEWYRNKGYDFTITSSTAYDQKWIPERNIFESISQVVDTIFSNFLSRPGVSQPIFTQYCDGKQVSCPNWMRQWESKTLGEQGYSAIEILRTFYGNSIYINSTDEISGIPASWPGYDLTIGSTGNKVRQLQNQLNVISDGYPLIPKLAEDGIYGQNTANSVRVFQQIFNLPATGVVDFATWYKISQIYVGVSRIAELV